MPKKVLLLKYQKWVSRLKNRYHCKKVEGNARINFSIGPCCTLLFCRKKKLICFGNSFISCSLQRTFAVGDIMNVWGYQHWNTANTTLDIFLLSENGLKSTQTRCKFCSNRIKCTATIEFCLTSVFLLTLNTFHTLL